MPLFKAPGSNLFILKIECGDITSMGELKSLFRKAAKNKHPDIISYDECGDGFKLLTVQYGEAREYLSRKVISGLIDHKNHNKMRDPQKDFFFY